jgi:hypothetical protein
MGVQTLLLLAEAVINCPLRVSTMVVLLMSLLWLVLAS